MVPALAIADALRDGEPGARVVFIGGERAERDLVPAAGYELRAVSVEGLSRTNPLKALRAWFRSIGAVVSSWRILGELRPAVVMGGGGYVAGPVGVAAVLRRIPLVLTEADSHLGISNRLLARFARRVCLAFPLAGRDGERYLVTGRPVPQPATGRGAARARFGVAADDTLLLVFGGSLGARSINEAALGAFADAAPCRVLHSAGTRDFATLDARPRGPHYDLVAYIEGFGQALAAADLVVGRSGGSVFELAAAGCASILIPYPHAAGDHQAGNARWMADAGAAIVIADAALGAARLRREVEELLADPGRLAAMRAAALRLARPDAAGVIAEEIRAAVR